MVLPSAHYHSVCVVWRVCEYGSGVIARIFSLSQSALTVLADKHGCTQSHLLIKVVYTSFLLFRVSGVSLQMDHVEIIEGHMVSIPTENIHDSVRINNCGVAISRRRLVSLHKARELRCIVVGHRLVVLKFVQLLGVDLE